GTVLVLPAGAAVARRRARHLTNPRGPALVEGGGAGHPDGGAPGTAHLADHERLIVPGAVLVVPAGAAVARRRARHRIDFRVPGLVEGGGAGHPNGGAPGAADLADHERLGMPGTVGVEPAGAAVARRPARHRTDLRVPALVEGGGGRDLHCGCAGGA